MRARTLCLWAAITTVGAPAVVDAQRGADNAASASRAFAEAERLFAAGAFAPAAKAFREAYALRPHFSVRCNIALCYERLGDFVGATDAYRACLDEGAAKTPRATRIEHSLNAVEARIAHIAVTSPPPGGEVRVDGRPAGPAPQRVPVNPGKHTVAVHREGTRPATADVELASGEEIELALVPHALAPPKPPRVLPQPEPEPPRRRDRRSGGLHKAWFWSGVGVTVGLSAAAIALGVSTLAARDSFEADPTQESYDSGIAKRTATNVLLGAAAACGAATTVLFFFTDFGGRSSRDDPRDDVAFGLGVRGSF